MVRYVYKLPTILLCVALVIAILAGCSNTKNEILTGNGADVIARLADGSAVLTGDKAALREKAGAVTVSFWGGKQTFSWQLGCSAYPDVQLALVDLDKDGSKELAVASCVATGSQTRRDEIHLIRRQGDGLQSLDLDADEMFAAVNQKLTFQVQGDVATLGFGNQRITAKVQTMEDGTLGLAGYCVPTDCTAVAIGSMLEINLTGEMPVVTAMVSLGKTSEQAAAVGTYGVAKADFTLQIQGDHLTAVFKSLCWQDQAVA